MLRRVQSFFDYLRVFSSLQDVQNFRRVAYGNGDRPIEVHVREAGPVPLRIRPHTSDAAVLWDTFHEKFHLPPAELSSDATILDLGANVGYTAAHFAHLHPRATILAVELDQKNFEAAQVNLQSVSRCQVIHAAVWSEDGTVSYDANEEEWAFHIDNDHRRADLASVAAKTVSTIIAEHQISVVDYIKMDIEGAEWPVLSTGADWLDKVKTMKVELHPKFNTNATYENCAKILRAHGFNCRKDDRHWDTLVALRS